MPGRKAHERPEKILLAMLNLAGGETKALKYEDIVVRAFELYPDEFALRGYPQYPDSSDIHKPLYGPLKKDGFVRSGNKTFALTARGVEAARQLSTAAGGDAREIARDGNRMTRDIKVEVDRMLASPATKLFADGDQGRILDTDFFNFAGCTVRTPKNDFLGRITATDHAVAMAKELGQPDRQTADLLERVWLHLQAQFKNLLEKRRGS